MKTLKISTILLVTLFIISCTPARDKMAKQITEQEKGLFTNGSPIPDKTKISDVIDLYKQYVSNYPKDSLSPIYLYSGANLLMNNGQYEEAIKFIDQITKDYTNFKKLPEAYFLKAFIYDNYIKNIMKARDAYTEFLQKYPKHDLAGDAQISIGNLGKTPDQIVKEFDKKAQSKSDSTNSVATTKKK
ncbi:MAG: tetratricopeptide repeat protein [Bacteroidota bacterium]